MPRSSSWPPVGLPEDLSRAADRAARRQVHRLGHQGHRPGRLPDRRRIHPRPLQPILQADRALLGPSHAEEVSRGKLSYLTVACTDPENARLIGSKFATDYIRLSYSTDLYGIEYGAILKNIYALAVGIAVGLGYGDNFLAVLIANCAGEMTRFLEESYPAEGRNTQVSAYLGDLLVTCYSVYSRNRRLGLLIGHGCTVKSALNEMTMVAEGYFAAECIRHINFRHKVDMPIAEMVYKVLYERASARRSMKELTLKLI